MFFSKTLDDMINNNKENIINNKDNYEYIVILEKDIFEKFLIDNNLSNNINIEYMVKNMINNKIKKIINKYNEINKLKTIVSNLEKLELPEQRSKEWYELRKGLLTASSLATALNEDHFKSRDELILDKCDDQEKPYISNEVTEWGVKYEEIATKFYEHLNKLKILEFGLIPHPYFKIFGASPDGICSNDSPDDYIGRMLEIKCPPKRKFTKTVPKHYWYQMQGQLECCNLEECDFLQVKICEYDTYDSYINDSNGNIGETKNGYPKGCTFTYRKQNDLKCSYYYPELFKTNEYYLKWIEDNKIKIKENNDEFIEAKWWYIERYECTLVKRDRLWWSDVMEEIYNFWEEVKYYKSNDKSELIERVNNKKKRKINNNKVNIQLDKCLIIT